MPTDHATDNDRTVTQDWPVERIAALIQTSGFLRPYTAPDNMTRAISTEEADAYAISLLAEKTPRIPINNGLVFAWDRLAESVSPQEALSFQRIITALTKTEAWLAWAWGRDAVLDGRRVYEARMTSEQEQYQLKRWRNRQVGTSATDSPRAIA